MRSAPVVDLGAAPPGSSVVAPRPSSRPRTFAAAACLLTAVACGGSGSPTAARSTATPAVTASSPVAVPAYPRAAPVPARTPTAARTAAAPPPPSATPAPPAPARPSPTVAAPAPLPPVTVTIRNFAFFPQNVVLAKGQGVVIVNADSAAHTWTAAPDSHWTYDSGNIAPGGRAAFPGLAQAGRYSLLCLYHAEMPLMNGTVTVR